MKTFRDQKIVFFKKAEIRSRIKEDSCFYKVSFLKVFKNQCGRFELETKYEKLPRF